MECECARAELCSLEARGWRIFSASSMRRSRIRRADNVKPDSTSRSVLFVDAMRKVKSLEMTLFCSKSRDSGATAETAMRRSANILAHDGGWQQKSAKTRNEH